MSVHLSARLAWHNDGWNGRICQRPDLNTFCIGPHSFPGERIAEERKLSIELEFAGQCPTKIPKERNYIPPCVYSINAFGERTLRADTKPPVFFRDATPRREWEVPPATVTIWPYEQMYSDEVKMVDGGYDAARRRELANAYFAEIQPNRSLVFYYANYSNPFNEGEENRYVLVGLGRVKSVGEEVCWLNQSADAKSKWGPNVWARNLSSHYPDQGFRVPYHLYRDQPDILERLLWVPENPRLFKYATRQFEDDQALSLVEQVVEIVGTLQDIGDTSENWKQRLEWLHGLLAELWTNRGLFPGLASIQQFLGAGAAVPWLMSEVAAGRERAAAEAWWNFMNGKSNLPGNIALSPADAKSISRKWRLLENDQQHVLRDVLPRFALPIDQIEKIISDERDQNGLLCSLSEIAKNPYLISEGFSGNDPDDGISWNTIDHGVFPSPELGGDPLGDKDDPRRLRALCVEQLKRESRHTFQEATQVIHDINQRLSYLPEWKRQQFKPKYLEVDKAVMEGALVQREERGTNYLYLRRVFEAERIIEENLRFLSSGPDIEPPKRNTLTQDVWKGFLYAPQSPLARRGQKDYDEAIAAQITVCSRVFRRPLAVLAGAAGTGKTTVIKSLISAIERVHGAGTSFQLLAPTGKAADRIRQQTGKSATTIHSFLARGDWLNDNLTLRTQGGKVESGVKTYIIDEASMLDLELAATLFRAIDWRSVQRVIFVGDPNQLPPIGRGRVFADLIEWLRRNQPESVAELSINLRQMENRLEERGAGILDLAALYTQSNTTLSVEGDSAESIINEEAALGKAQAEQLLARVQEGGDVDRDLRVVFWDDAGDLETKLVEEIIRGMSADTGRSCKVDDGDAIKELWKTAWSDGDKGKRPEYLQVLSPYRGEVFGTDYLNIRLQQRFNGSAIERFGQMAAITLFDKVIQIRNRPKSNRINAYNYQSKRTEPIEIYNGEIGFVKPHGFDSKKLGWPNFFLEHFQVVFAGKGDFWVGYGRKLGKNSLDKWIRVEKIDENLELAYVISVHKAQGSEFDRIYFVLPKNKTALLSTELFYTALTRAARHATLLVEEDISPLLRLRRRESSHLLGINSSLLEFRTAPSALQKRGWYEDQKIYATLADVLVRSKSEVIISNLLSERRLIWQYEAPLYARDGTFYLPDFTINWRGENWYWEHWGRMDDEKYRNHAETKRTWYSEHFPGRLVETWEAPDLSAKALEIISRHFSV